MDNVVFDILENPHKGYDVAYRRGYQVREGLGYRWLCLERSRTTRPTVETLMSITEPHKLVLSYGQYMLAPMLFGWQPSSVLMLGLGGGMIPRYLCHQFTDADVEVVEINEVIVDWAYEYFELPKQLLQVILDDANQWIRRKPLKQHDCVMVDLYLGSDVAPFYFEESFHQACSEHLTDNGVCVLNLLTLDKECFAKVFQVLKAQYPGGVMCASIPDTTNIVFYAFKQTPQELRIIELQKQAMRLQSKYQLPFMSIMGQIQKEYPIAQGAFVLP